MQRPCTALGATAAFMLQLQEEEQDGDIHLGAGVRGDAWFGSVKAVEALAQIGYKAVLYVKTGQRLFPMNFVEYSLKDAPGDVCLDCASVNKHNQAHQAELAFEKHWLMQNSYIPLHTTLIKMNVVDCYKTADHHKIYQPSNTG